MNRLNLLYLSLCVVLSVVSAINEEFVKKLAAAQEVTAKRIKEIYDEWQVDKYPSFLHSGYMHKSSLEIMKWKYMQKLLTAHVENKKERFVVSFTGSSVTAGHDSLFNVTTTPNVGRLMKEPFEAAGIEFVSRNVALGNNPCIPYDVCVKYFVGMDADVAVWEQNYFCHGAPLEIFIRQAMTIPTQPIVAFSSSSTGHWEQNQCKTEEHKITEAEQSYLKSDLINLVSDLNKDLFHSHWGDSQLQHKDRHYHGAALQAFTHHGHEAYACLGPYIKKWMEGAASWHPSVVAHRLRASQMSYFWLRIFELALKELHDLASHRQLDAIKQDLEHHLVATHPPMPALTSFIAFPDNAVCYTDYEPRAERKFSLKDKVIDKADGLPWPSMIYEDLVDKNLVQRSHENGYLDYKWLLYAKDNNKPLSLAVDMKVKGPVYVCETPGIWGKLPDGFSHLREGQMDVYMTFKIDGFFKFDKSKAVMQQFFHIPDLDLCVQLKHMDNSTSYPEGDHALTIVPHEKANLIVAWLITP